MSPTCFDALDRHVVGGRADHVAVRVSGRDWTYAQLLEEVAAFGGVLQHSGVVAGDRVVVALPSSVESVVVVLACARIGAVHDVAGDAGKVLVRVSDASVSVVTGVVIVKQVPGAEVELTPGREYDYDVVMRDGRTDPAAWLDGATITPYDEPTRALVEPLLAGGSLDLRV